ncbi:MAG: hypothetical protein RR494_12635 [Vagococcus sp.]|uniref:hypothetical protein n=1 Tax=Vagococcus sp. TaxID=1933889 RepID=UPI002FC8F26A
MLENLIGSTFVAVASVLGSYITVNKYTQRKIDEISNEFKNIMENRDQIFISNQQLKQIDADLIAKARIKWIQDVRFESINVITNLKNVSNISSSKKTDEMLESIYKVEKSLYRVLLFFGDDSENSQEMSGRVTLKKRESNKNCNQIIVHNINNIIGIIQSKIQIIEEKEKKSSIKSTLQAQKIYFMNEETEVSIFLEDLEKYEKLGINMEAFSYIDYDDTREIIIEKINKKISSIEKEESSLSLKINENDLNIMLITEEFTNMIRDYLKIEWKIITKERK